MAPRQRMRSRRVGGGRPERVAGEHDWGKYYSVLVPG
jgi:hypothetical protein